MEPDKKMRPYELIVRGARLNVWIGGRGPILLLLYAGRDSEFSWHYIWTSLTDTFTVIVPDLMEFGKTERGRMVSAPNLTRIFADLVRQFEVTRDGVESPITVVGHSLGGALAFRFAQDYPALTKKLILVNGLEMPELSGWLRKVLMMPFVHGLFSRLGEAFFCSDRALKDALMNVEVRPAVRSSEASAPSSQNSEISEPSWSNPELATTRIEAPISLIWGEGDETLAPALTDKIRREYPSAVVRFITQAGRLPKIEQPAKFVFELKDAALR